VSQERNVSISRSSIPDFHSALAWAVQTYDTEFAGSSSVKLTIEETSVLDNDTNEWRPQWTAAVFGMTEENA
jgi:hypothetical protein